MAGELDQELLIDADTLPTLPAVYLRVKNLIDDPDSGMDEIAEAIRLDPALSTRFLRIANSALYGLRNTISTISHAVNLLGASMIHDIVLATSVSEVFEGMQGTGMDVGRFWRESLELGICARATAAELRMHESERLFLHGLLADIGHLIIYVRIPGLATQARLRAENTVRPLHLVEREMFGIDHAEVGGMLAEHWQLPDVLIESIRYQYRPQQRPLRAADIAVVNAARYVAFARREGVTSLHPGVIRDIDLTAESLEHIVATSDELVAETMSLFSMPTARVA